MLKGYYEKIKYTLNLSNHSKDDLGLNIDISRDWRILCVIFLLFIGIVLLGNIYIFSIGYGLRKNDVSGLTEDTLKLDYLRLDRVVREWQEREVTFNKILEERVVIVDPAL